GSLAGVLHLVIVWLGFAALAFLWKEERLSGQRFLQLAAALAMFDASATLFISGQSMYTPGTVGWWDVSKARHRPIGDFGAAGLTRYLQPPEELGSHPNNRNIALKIPVFKNYITMWNRF